MLLPVISPEERTSLQGVPPGNALQALESRLGLRLVSTLGVEVSVFAYPAETSAASVYGRGEPEIRIDDALAAGWLGARFGGLPGSAKSTARNPALESTLQSLMRRTLAESVINRGAPEWPSMIRLKISICGHEGHADIIWNGEQALSWARRAIGGKP